MLDDEEVDQILKVERMLSLNPGWADQRQVGTKVKIIISLITDGKMGVEG